MKNRKPNRRAQAQDKEIFVYNGRVCLGIISQTGDRYKAETPDGVALGVFSNSRDAADAILKSARASA